MQIDRKLRCCCTGRERSSTRDNAKHFFFRELLALFYGVLSSPFSNVAKVEYR